MARISKVKIVSLFDQTALEMAASAVYILDLKGKVLISRNYRGDMPLNIIEKFPKMLMEAEEEGTVSWSEIVELQ